MEISGEWLRGQRTAHNLTREEFAKRIRCSVAMLHKIENDERRPSEQMADLMANCLDVPLTLSQIEAIQAQAGGKILEAVVEDLLEYHRIFSIGWTYPIINLWRLRSV